MYLLFTIYYLLFTFITWTRFRLGLILLFALLPTYLIRFNIGPLPMTLLEGMVWIVIIIWFCKKIKKNWQLVISNCRISKIITNYKLLITKNKLLFTAITIFLLSATVAIFTSVDIRAAAGEWKAFYIEPFLIFIVLITTLNQKPKSQLPITNYQLPTNFVSALISALIVSGLVTSILAIYQHFTGWMVPWDFWENRNTFRVTGWYGYPNAVGLFLAPLVPLALYSIIQCKKQLQKKHLNIKTFKHKSRSINPQSVYMFICLYVSILFLICAPLAIIFAKSTGALVGITAGIGLLLLFFKKTRWPAIAIGLVGFVSLVSLPSLEPVREEIFFQDRSGQIRLAMWDETIQMLSDRPIVGAGLASHSQRIIPYHRQVNGENIEIFHLPHNIFLAMWSNLGLLGLIGFILMLIWFFKSGLENSKQPSSRAQAEGKTVNRKLKNKLQVTDYRLQITPFLLSSMTAVIVMSLVDTPYMKNDLALFFWLLIALMIVRGNKAKLEEQK